MNPSSPSPEDLPETALRAFRTGQARRHKLFAGVAALFVVSAAVLGWAWLDQSGFEARKQAATAHVTARHHGRTSSTLDLTVRVAGRDYETTLRDTDGQPGDDIPVFYDPQDPEVVAAPDESLHGTLIAYSIAGTVFCGLLLAGAGFAASLNRRVANGAWRPGTATALTPGTFRVQFRDGTSTPTLRVRNAALPDGFREGPVTAQRLWGRRWMYILSAQPTQVLTAVEQPGPLPR